MKTRLFILAIALATVASISFARSNNTPTPKPHPGPIAQRKQNQQNRIANGIRSGQLTAGETKNLEGREANLNRNERQMRAADGGRLTGADRTRLNHQENNISNHIYADKHNARTATYGNNEVGARRRLQQDRIAQGIRSGQMTPGEARRQEGREQGLNRQISGMRQANGGPLTPGQKAYVNQQQNKQSREIYNEKHNDKTGY
jgi:hypothetical protein